MTTASGGATVENASVASEDQSVKKRPGRKASGVTVALRAWEEAGRATAQKRKAYARLAKAEEELGKAEAFEKEKFDELQAAIAAQSQQ